MDADKLARLHQHHLSRSYLHKFMDGVCYFCGISEESYNATKETLPKNVSEVKQRRCKPTFLQAEASQKQEVEFKREMLL